MGNPMTHESPCVEQFFYIEEFTIVFCAPSKYYKACNVTICFVWCRQSVVVLTRTETEVPPAGKYNNNDMF